MLATSSFGSGIAIATNTAAGSTPVQFAALQDITLDISRTIKTLYGQNQFPIAIGSGEIKITGKAKFGQVNGALYNQLFFSGTTSTGTTKLAYNEAGTIPSATPYTVTVANSATFVADQGVVYSATGTPLTQVASSPAAGQYSVSAGVYTFSASDAGKGVLISYTYTVASTGNTLTVTNPLQGVQPVFSLIVSRSYNNTGERFLLTQCVASKLSLPTKMADFSISELDFECFADTSGKIIVPYSDQ